ncbi:MAG: antibiotic biosynthesis monooxygenase family protein [Candidatus Binataceae bacterium]
MIRVMYRWRVKPGGENAFRRAWETGTVAIRRVFKGSHGSLLMQSKEVPLEFAGVARWDSVEAWRSAHQSPQWPPDRESTRIVHAVAGKTIATEIFEELSDLTVS